MPSEEMMLSSLNTGSRCRVCGDAEHEGMKVGKQTVTAQQGLVVVITVVAHMQSPTVATSSPRAAELTALRRVIRRDVAALTQEVTRIRPDLAGSFEGQ